MRPDELRDAGLVICRELMALSRRMSWAQIGWLLCWPLLLPLAMFGMLVPPGRHRR